MTQLTLTLSFLFCFYAAAFNAVPTVRSLSESHRLVSRFYRDSWSLPPILIYTIPRKNNIIIHFQKNFVNIFLCFNHYCIIICLPKLMKLTKLDYLFSLLILIISCLFVLELFLFPGRPANFDSNFHISNIAQFSKIIASGELPVIWMNSFANYGLPMGIFAHQVTSYLGGVITFLTHNPTTSYNILVFIAIFLSNLFLYFFLRFYFSPLASFLGTFIFSFTPYRIFNIYIRGAMPEVFSGIFLPLILIALYLFIVKKKIYALFLLALFIAGLTLNHPMMLVVYSSVFIPYLIFLLITNGISIKSRITNFVTVSLFMLLGVFLSSYYIIPLNLEIKYFYYGLIKNHIDPSTYLSLTNYFDPRWYYFTKNEIFPRGHVVQFGLIETITLIIGFIYVLYAKLLKKGNKNIQILYFALILAIINIFFTIKFSDLFFQKLFFLNSIQFPWRFLSSLIFVPPMVAAFLYDRFPKKIILFGVVFLVALFSFPQLYGKNFNLYPIQSYFFAKENAHSVLMNTIWTGKSEDYPDKNPQGEIVEGKGKIIAETLKNSSRMYTVNAATSLTMVDHTFYFPGWKVYVDGNPVTIEFQNPDYRGVITYQVPPGKHSIYVVFEDTKVRLLGKVLSVVSLILFFALFFLRNRIGKIVKL